MSGNAYYPRWVVVFIVMFGSTGLLFSQEFDAVSTERPFDAYFNWLQEHQYDSEFASVLEKAIENITKLEDAELLIDTYIYAIPKETKESLLLNTAQLASQASNPEKAWKYYNMLLVLTNEPDIRMQMAAQSMLLGKYDRALQELNENQFTNESLDRSLVYRMHAFALLADVEKVLATMQRIRLGYLEGQELLMMFQLADALEFEVEVKRIQAEIDQREDPVLSLVIGQGSSSYVALSPSPLTLFSMTKVSQETSVRSSPPLEERPAPSQELLEEATPFGMQVGAFRDLTNAIYFAESLLTFHSNINVYEVKLENESIFRVYVLNEERLSTEPFILTMKSQKIEGVVQIDTPESAIPIARERWDSLRKN